MFDQRLWDTHIHLREQQFMREAENDRLAHESSRSRPTGSLFRDALRDAFAIFRARLTASARADAKPAAAQPPIAGEHAITILAEAEEVVRLRWINTSHTPSDCPCDIC
jgi:hypothetical protein